MPFHLSGKRNENSLMIMVRLVRSAVQCSDEYICIRFEKVHFDNLEIVKRVEVMSSLDFVL